jgi:glutamyl-tRNA synthetase
MQISHVIRGDDHVNNTPRQINILQALGATVPEYGHVPMILGPDGEKLSKRHGAVSVLDYQTQGYLPSALLNYLSRLGWSHGDEEVFSRQQLVDWFDGSHLAKSPAQWDVLKLNWLNSQYLKALPQETLCDLVHQQLRSRDIQVHEHQPLAAMCALFRDRCATTLELADWVRMYFAPVQPTPQDIETHVTAAIQPALATLCEALTQTPWDKANIAAAIKSTLNTHSLKMPQLAHAVRVLVCGHVKTPSLDAVLELFSREIVIKRLRA